LGVFFLGELPSIAPIPRIERLSGVNLRPFFIAGIGFAASEENSTNGFTPALGIDMRIKAPVSQSLAPRMSCHRPWLRVGPEYNFGLLELETQFIHLHSTSQLHVLVQQINDTLPFVDSASSK